MSKKTVSPRISLNTEIWLTEAFGSKGAGAEYILEAACAVQRRCIVDFKSLFSPDELKLMIDCFNGHILSPQSAGQSIKLSVSDSIIYDALDSKWGVDKATLLEKLEALPLPSRMFLEVWIKGFWEQHPKLTLETYISPMQWGDKVVLEAQGFGFVWEEYLLPGKRMPEKLLEVMEKATSWEDAREMWKK